MRRSSPTRALVSDVRQLVDVVSSQSGRIMAHQAPAGQVWVVHCATALVASASMNLTSGNTAGRHGTLGRFRQVVLLLLMLGSCVVGYSHVSRPQHEACSRVVVTLTQVAIWLWRPRRHILSLLE